MKKVIMILVMFTLAAFTQNPSTKEIFSGDSRDYTANVGPDGEPYYYIERGRVVSVGVKTNRIVTKIESIKNPSIVHVFYCDKTQKEILALLISAKSSQSPIRAFFFSDENSADIEYQHHVATHRLDGVELVD